MRCHYKLKNLPFEFKPFDVEIPKRPELNEIVETEILIDDTKKFNPEFFEWVKEHNILLIFNRYFESAPGATYDLHRDTQTIKNKDLLKIVNFNFIFDSYGSEMRWYHTNEGYDGYLYKNPLGQEIIGYDKDKCTEIYRAQTDEHCMISGGIIHTLINSQQQQINRKCYSYTMVNYHWNKAEDYFKDFLE